MYIKHTVHTLLSKGPEEVSYQDPTPCCVGRCLHIPEGQVIQVEAVVEPPIAPKPHSRAHSLNEEEEVSFCVVPYGSL